MCEKIFFLVSLLQIIVIDLVTGWEYLLACYRCCCNVCLKVVSLSDLFAEREQFEWMLDTMFEVYKAHPGEDEIALQYLNVGICKAAAVVGVVSYIFIPSQIECFREYTGISLSVHLCVYIHVSF